MYNRAENKYHDCATQTSPVSAALPQYAAPLVNAMSC
jgi:hypothetical protein